SAFFPRRDGGVVRAPAPPLPPPPRHYDDVLRLIPEPQPKATRQAARNTILIAIVTVHEGNRGLRNCQTTTPGGADRNGVFWVGEGNHGEANEESHRTAGAHGMFFEDLLEAPHLRHGHFLAEGTVLHHVPIFLRHELLKTTRKFDIIKTHPAPPSLTATGIRCSSGQSG